MKVKIIILKEKDMKSILTMSEAIKSVEYALSLYSKGKTDIPLRINIDIDDQKGQSLYMPGYVADADALGIKIISVYPNNIKKGLSTVPSTMVLLNHETGEVCSVMDGTYLTRLRTGAVSGAATKILSKKDSKIFSLFGTGGQAESQLEAVLTVRDIEEVRVYDINLDRAKAFAKEMSEKFESIFKVKIYAVESPEEAVKDSDIITAVTTSKEPVFDSSLVKKGTHINGVGSYTPDMQELDEGMLCRADKIYVDTKDGVLNESGDFIIPIRQNKFSEDRVTGELGELLIGNVLSRENDEEITLFKTVGSSVLDIVTGRHIYEKALEQSIGHIVEF